MRAIYFSLCALGASCGCPTYDEIVIVDRDGVATPEQEAEARAAVADFAAWTGREGVCVSEVEFREDVGVRTIDEREIHAAGRYNPVTGRILINHSFPAVREVVFHELCHARDHQEGITRRSGSDLPIPEGFNTSLYPTRRGQEKELLALACEHGPGLRATWEAIYDECLPSGDGAFATHPALWLAREVVFREAPRPEFITGGLEIEIEETWRSAEFLASWFSSDDAIVDGTLQVIISEPLVAQRPGAPASGQQIVSWQELDLASASILSAVEIDVWTEDPRKLGNRYWYIISGFDGDGRRAPLLYSIEDGEKDLWRLDDATGRPQFIADLELGGSSPPVRSGDILYNTAYPAGQPTVQAWDLTTGEEVDLAFDDLSGRGEDRDIYQLEATPDGIRVRSEHLGISTYDTADGTWRHQIIPAWWGMGKYAEGEGGIFVVETPLFVDDEGVAWVGRVGLDPEDGAWLLPDDPCASFVEDTARWIGQGDGGPHELTWLEGEGDSDVLLQRAWRARRAR